MANPKKRKLAAIRKLFEQREQAATAKFATASEQLRLERGKDEDMQAFLSEYRGRYRTDGSSGMPAGVAKGWVRFLTSLESACEVQRLQAQRAQQFVDTSRTHVVSSRLRVRAGEKLEQRLKNTLARQAARGERRQLDEMSKRGCSRRE